MLLSSRKRWLCEGKESEMRSDLRRCAWGVTRARCRPTLYCSSLSALVSALPSRHSFVGLCSYRSMGDQANDKVNRKTSSTELSNTSRVSNSSSCRTQHHKLALVDHLTSPPSSVQLSDAHSQNETKQHRLMPSTRGVLNIDPLIRGWVSASM